MKSYNPNSMQYEKIIKKDNGSRIKITVNFYADFRGHEWNATAYYCAPGKRTFGFRPDGEEAATTEEIQSAKLELWEQLKPTP